MAIHVIIGSDDYLVDSAAKRFVREGDCLEIVDSLTSTNAESQIADFSRVRESLMNPSLFEPSKTTWWKNVHFLPGSGGKKESAEEVKEEFGKFVEWLGKITLPENQTFVLSGPSMRKDTLFAKALMKIADVAILNPSSEREAGYATLERVNEFARERKLQFENGVAAKFIALAGMDTRTLVSELDKLAAYLGKDRHTVTEADVATIVSRGSDVEPKPWNVTDAIGERNLAKALKAMEFYELQNGFDVMMTTVIEKFFRQLYDFATGNTEGLTPFTLSKFKNFLRHWPVKRLRVARARFLQLRERAVSGAPGTAALITTELVRLCA